MRESVVCLLQIQGPSTTQDEDGTVHVHQGRKGRTDDRICFYGHVKGKTWGTVDTYGGKIVENCLAGHTQVLSESRGWVELHTVTTEDRVWDGVEFVDHGGLVNKGKATGYSVSRGCLYS